MPEQKTTVQRSLRLRHRGRSTQVGIYFGKLLRMFVYQNDWKVLPMAALIAALVSMVIRQDFFSTMEGDLKGAFALTCVGVWNGCFNSIQVICRERGVIKREHRSGMHISSYIVSHMLYQALLCAGQTVVSLYVCRLMGVRFPDKGIITGSLMLDLSITLFLVSYAADMLSLWISALSHTTTAAMTVMPFVLIFQLVFSGGPFFNLPGWTRQLSGLTISNYGLKCIAAQADYNSMPMTSAWTTLNKLRSREVGGTLSLGQVLDYLSDPGNGLVNALRDRQISGELSVGSLWSRFSASHTYRELRDRRITLQSVQDTLGQLQTGEDFAEVRQLELAEGVTVADAIDFAVSLASDTELTQELKQGEITVGQLLDGVHLDTLMDAMKNQKIHYSFKLGQLIDELTANEDLQLLRDQSVTYVTTVGDIIHTIGEEKLKTLITQKTAEVSQVPDYDMTEDNILYNWFCLLLFILGFAFLATITLELIDKDKR